jgi:hypothetical protein
MEQLAPGKGGGTLSHVVHRPSPLRGSDGQRCALALFFLPAREVLLASRIRPEQEDGGDLAMGQAADARTGVVRPSQRGTAEHPPQGSKWGRGPSREMGPGPGLPPAILPGACAQQEGRGGQSDAESWRWTCRSLNRIPIYVQGERG